MKQLEQSVIDAIRAQAPRVQNGTYTVNHPKQGHFTVKLWTSTKGSLAGKRLLSLLTGPDNTADFTTVAFWNDQGGYVNVWKRFKGIGSTMSIDGYNWQANGWSSYEQKLAIWCDLATRGATPEKHGYWFSEGYELLLEARCCRCNRKLTHPESIMYGIGPECAQKVGA